MEGSEVVTPDVAALFANTTCFAYALDLRGDAVTEIVQEAFASCESDITADKAEESAESLLNRARDEGAKLVAKEQPGDKNLAVIGIPNALLQSCQIERHGTLLRMSSKTKIDLAEVMKVIPSEVP
jgi:hypothetical protein